MLTRLDGPKYVEKIQEAWEYWKYPRGSEIDKVEGGRQRRRKTEDGRRSTKWRVIDGVRKEDED